MRQRLFISVLFSESMRNKKVHVLCIFCRAESVSVEHINGGSATCSNARFTGGSFSVLQQVQLMLLKE